MLEIGIKKKPTPKFDHLHEIVSVMRADGQKSRTIQFVLKLPGRVHTVKTQLFLLHFNNIKFSFNRHYEAMNYFGWVLQLSCMCKPSFKEHYSQFSFSFRKLCNLSCLLCTFHQTLIEKLVIVLQIVIKEMKLNTLKLRSFQRESRF